MMPRNHNALWGEPRFLNPPGRRTHSTIWLAVATSASSVPTSAIYILSDSLSDQGNMKRATEIIDAPARVLRDPAHYFDGRFSNGPIYADYLAGALGKVLEPSIVRALISRMAARDPALSSGLL